MSEAWIETASGIKFDILEPTVDMVTIEDIAHALSQLNRFTGHTKYPYSVGQHSLHCSHLVPHEDALWALLHDASEAYIGDMNRPLKHFSEAGGHYQKVETNVMAVICQKFGLPLEEPASVEKADRGMLYAEKVALMPGTPSSVSRSWGRSGSKTPANVLIVEMHPLAVEKYFLKRFEILTQN